MLHLDTEFYRARHADLAKMTDDQIRAHFARYGVNEGRLCGPSAVRETFLEDVKSHASVLEIGPFCNPQVRGSHVRYFDVLDTAGLLDRANRIGYEVKSVPKIHYVSLEGDLSVVTDRFAAALSCHCIEHQPDLVRHLQQVDDLLADDGLYYLIVPDKRFCFDHFIPETTLADILDAHFSERRVHRLASVIEHRALTVHNDCVRHWNGDHGEESPDLVGRTRKAIEEFEHAEGGYVDVHAWQFTPESFERSIVALHELGYSPLRPLRVHATPRNRNEFTAVLCK